MELKLASGSPVSGAKDSGVLYPEPFPCRPPPCSTGISQRLQGWVSPEAPVTTRRHSFWIFCMGIMPCPLYLAEIRCAYDSRVSLHLPSLEHMNSPCWPCEPIGGRLLLGHHLFHEMLYIRRPLQFRIQNQSYHSIFSSANISLLSLQSEPSPRLNITGGNNGIV